MNFHKILFKNLFRYFFLSIIRFFLIKIFYILTLKGINKKLLVLSALVIISLLITYISRLSPGKDEKKTVDKISPTKGVEEVVEEEVIVEPVPLVEISETETEAGTGSSVHSPKRPTAG